MADRFIICRRPSDQENNAFSVMNSVQIDPWSWSEKSIASSAIPLLRFPYPNGFVMRKQQRWRDPKRFERLFHITIPEVSIMRCNTLFSISQPINRQQIPVGRKAINGTVNPLFFPRKLPNSLAFCDVFVYYITVAQKMGWCSSVGRAHPW